MVLSTYITCVCIQLLTYRTNIRTELVLLAREDVSLNPAQVACRTCTFYTTLQSLRARPAQSRRTSLVLARDGPLS